MPPALGHSSTAFLERLPSRLRTCEPGTAFGGMHEVRRLLPPGGAVHLLFRGKWSAGLQIVQAASAELQQVPARLPRSCRSRPDRSGQTLRILVEWAEPGLIRLLRACQAACSAVRARIGKLETVLLTLQLGCELQARRAVLILFKPLGAQSQTICGVLALPML